LRDVLMSGNEYIQARPGNQISHNARFNISGRFHFECPEMIDI